MRVYEADWDWKFKTDRYEDFKYMLKKRGHLVYDLADVTKLSRSSVSVKLNGAGSPWFTDKQVQEIAKLLRMTSEEVHEYFISNHKERFRPEWESKEAKIPPSTGCFRSGNGFEFRYIVDGKIHSTYGATEMEARKNAEVRQKEQEMPKMVKDDKAELKISKEEAMVLVDQLFHDVMNGQCKSECQQTIKSIYWRLTTQFMV